MDRAGRRMVLEVGCGECPWVSTRSIVRSGLVKECAPFITPIVDEYADVDSGDLFLCLDISAEQIEGAKEWMGKLKKGCPDVDVSRIVLDVCDCTKLPFADGTADVVIIADVLSAPYLGASCDGFRYPDDTCISKVVKWKMVREAMRVLKDTGMFVVCIQQTPCYATEVVDLIERRLVNKGIIRLVKQCGRFVSETDNWHLYHAAFQKKPGTATPPPEIIPWTPEQKAYIKEEESYWLSRCR